MNNHVHPTFRPVLAGIVHTPVGGIVPKRRHRYDATTELLTTIERDGAEVNVSVTVYGDCDRADPSVGINGDQWHAEKFEACDSEGKCINLTPGEEEALREEAEMQLAKDESDWHEEQRSGGR